MFTFTEGGSYLLPLALIFLGCKYHKQAPMLGATFLWCALLFAKAYYSYSSGATASGTLYEHLTFASEFMMVAVIRLIWLYNGMVVKLKNRSSISFIQFTFGSFT